MSLPFEIRQQIIQCIGTCFHYKDTVEAFFISCGVDRQLASNFKHEPKFVWARMLLAELENYENGTLLQRRILTELCKLKKLPDKDVQNPDAGLDALRALKKMALDNKIEIEEERSNIDSKRSLAQEKLKNTQIRASKLLELKTLFSSAIVEDNRQRAGYALEDIIERLFSIYSIEYRKPYKTNTQQIDGHFNFDGFDYLVEAKWRNDQPSEQEIGGFKRKIETKLDSTRGVFISINGFREDVIQEYEGHGCCILFFTGEDISLILEGLIELDEVLRRKIQVAAQTGKTNFPVHNML